MSLPARLFEVYESIQSFHVPFPRLPIIDSTPADDNEALPGLRFLRDELKRDCDVSSPLFSLSLR